MKTKMKTLYLSINEVDVLVANHFREQGYDVMGVDLEYEYSYYGNEKYLEGYEVRVKDRD